MQLLSRAVRWLVSELAADGILTALKILALWSLPTILGLYLTWWAWVGDAALWIRVLLTIVVVLATLAAATLVVLGVPPLAKQQGRKTSLDLDVEIGSYSVNPVGAGQAQQIHRLLDVLIVSREPKRLDVRIKLVLQMPDGSEWVRPALIECPGRPTAYAEQPSLFHLPTEVALLPDGAPVRGHVDFTTPNPVEPEEVFAEVEDLRSRRTYRKRISTDGRKSILKGRERVGQLAPLGGVARYRVLPQDNYGHVVTGEGGKPGSWFEVGIADEDILITSLELNQVDPIPGDIAGDLGVGPGGGERTVFPVARTGILPFPIEVKAGERIAIRAQHSRPESRSVRVRVHYLGIQDVVR